MYLGIINVAFSMLVKKMQVMINYMLQYDLLRHLAKDGLQRKSCSQISTSFDTRHRCYQSMLFWNITNLNRSWIFRDSLHLKIRKSRASSAEEYCETLEATFRKSQEGWCKTFCFYSDVRAAPRRSLRVNHCLKSHIVTA